MGNYTIVIKGHGINHNGTPKDADEIAAATVAALRGSGQDDVEGFFVYGVDLTKQLKDTMPIGEGGRKLEPLFPMCEQMVKKALIGGKVVTVTKDIIVPDKAQVWDERCKTLASSARVYGTGFNGKDLGQFVCDEHRRREGTAEHITLRHMQAPNRCADDGSYLAKLDDAWECIRCHKVWNLISSIDTNSNTSVVL